MANRKHLATVQIGMEGNPEAVVMVSLRGDSVALAVAKRSGGEIEVLLSSSQCRELVAFLQQAIAQVEQTTE